MKILGIEPSRYETAAAIVRTPLPPAPGAQ